MEEPDYESWTTDELIEECRKRGILKGENRNESRDTDTF
jgi:hypothetical protein